MAFVVCFRRAMDDDFFNAGLDLNIPLEDGFFGGFHASSSGVPDDEETAVTELKNRNIEIGAKHTYTIWLCVVKKNVTYV